MGAFADTAAEIRRLCGYIKSDTYIAQYIGVSPERVAKIRKSIPPARPYGTQSDNWRVTHRGPSQDRAFEDMCRDGSRKLLEAYARYYQRNVAA